MTTAQVFALKTAQVAALETADFAAISTSSIAALKVAQPKPAAWSPPAKGSVGRAGKKAAKSN